MVAAVMYIARLIFKPRELLSVGFVQGGVPMVAQKPASGIPDNGLAIGPAIDARGRYQTLAALRENMCGGMDAQCKCDGNETM